MKFSIQILASRYDKSLQNYVFSFLITDSRRSKFFDSTPEMICSMSEKCKNKFVDALITFTTKYYKEGKLTDADCDRIISNALSQIYATDVNCMPERSPEIFLYSIEDQTKTR